MYGKLYKNWYCIDCSIGREQIMKHKCITLIFPISCAPHCYSAGTCYVLWTYSMRSLFFCALKQDTMNTYSQDHDADSVAAASLCFRESNEHSYIYMDIYGFLQGEIGRSFFIIYRCSSIWIFIYQTLPFIHAHCSHNSQVVYSEVL